MTTASPRSIHGQHVHAGTPIEDLRLSPWYASTQGGSALPDRDDASMLHAIARRTSTATNAAGSAGDIFQVHGRDLNPNAMLLLGGIVHHASSVSGTIVNLRFWGERDGYGPEKSDNKQDWVEHFGQHLFDLALTAGGKLLASGSKFAYATGQSAFAALDAAHVTNSSVLSPGVRIVGYGFPLLCFDKLGCRRIWCAAKLDTADRFRLVTAEV